MTLTTALDPFPHLHIRPERGWVNDPNGLGFWDGRWHVFYQHNPDVPRHEAICWGHASSADLVTWRDEGVALRPRPGAIDAAGVWSGVATTDDDGAPVLAYTAVPDVSANAGVALARPDGDGGWVADATMVAPRPDDPTIRDVRDPFLFHLGGHRYAVQGAGRTDGTPLVLVYDASDLDDWRLLGPLLDGADPAVRTLAPAEIWECPSLVRLRSASGEHSWVLVVSRWHSGGDHDLRGVAALVGDLVIDDGRPRFVPRAGAELDSGPDFYAPQAYDAGDRVLLWGWTWEGRGPDAPTPWETDAAGWAGALTFPRELGLDGDRVTSAPAPELTALRREALAVAGSEASIAVPAWEAEARGAVVVALAGPDGEREVWRSPRAAADGVARVLVDGSVVEAFAGGDAHTVRAYPRAGESWVVRAAGDLSVWELGRPTP